MRVLLNIDDGKHWHAVARLIGVVARAGGAKVTVVSTQFSASARADAFEKAVRLLGLPPEQVETVSRPGLVEEALPHVARDGRHDLVVVGRLGSLDWITNGLVASLLVRRIPTNVLIVRGRVERFHRVLVATAGPTHGSKNIDLTVRLARPLGAEVTVLHVLNEMPLTFEGEAELERLSEHFLETEAPESKHLLAARADLERRGVKAGVKVRVGTVVEEVLREIQEGRHDLLVFGAHLPEPGAGFLYENIAGLLVRASPSSFLVVREPPPDI